MSGFREPIGSRPRWGIIGAGNICNDFSVGLVNNGSTITAVGARDMPRAEEFAEKIGASRAFGSYEEVVEDPDVDVVYVGTIHTQHHAHVKLALEAGKHVLCEKPMGMNAAETTELVELARTKGLFLMEGMWTRFFPAIRKAKELMTSGELGEPKYVQGDFGFVAPTDPTHRLWDLTQGGGATLDIGCYLVQAATWAFGPTVPESIASTGRKTADGVDADGVIALTWEGKGSASLLFTITRNSPEELLVVCEKGYIRVHGPAHCPTRITVAKEEGRGEYDIEVLEFPLPELPEGLTVNNPNSEGMMYQAEAVEQSVVAGELESPEFPLEESLAIIKIMDAHRKQVGVVYPFEWL